MSALNIGAKAMTTNLAVLQVIGNNIANVNTPGYSRQSVELKSAGYQDLGNGFYGKGVDINTVTRAHDAYLTREAQLATSVASADKVILSKMKQLEQLFPTGSAGLGSTMNDMLNAWTDVASSPSNLTARTVAISRGDELAAQMRDTAGQLDLLQNTSQQQMRTTVDNVNRLAKDIATVNQRIKETQGQPHTPNDLLDQRDQLISQLNQYVQTSSVLNTDGTTNVFVAGSLPLVLGSEANKLATLRDAGDPSQMKVAFVQAGQNTLLSANAMGGGELAGLMRFLSTDLPQAQNELGRMALALATEVNNQHALGVDLKGNTGTNFFVPPARSVGVANAGNSGSAAIGAAVSNASALMASDYEISFDASGVNVRRLSDGSTQSFAALPAEVDGLRFELDSGAAATGDRFIVRPFAAAARNLTMAIGAPDQLAAASPLQAQPASSNAGGLSIESMYAVQSSANLTDPVSISFLANGSFTVTGAAPGSPAPDNPGPPASYNYVPGQAISFNGWSLTLRGSPSAGDSFAVGAAPAGSSAQNGGNAGALLALRDKPTFEGASLSDGYIGLLSSVGTKVQGAQFAAEFSAQLAGSTESARAAVSGVNLDEEAARLLQYQQAYQAAAKFLQIAQSTFDTLMQSVGR
ncbi:flagellar hook-associated protein FlgK [Hydrogenophaga sp.]|uniref:flagellar hook-associated protein FlgK n=1 Tax=Hydrogenophaga sp. TaxID=1904254 RepID=UPI003564A58C